MSVHLAWSEYAEEALRNIPWLDAAWIASEVARYAEHGVGDVRRVPLASGSLAPVLFLPGYRVVLSYDRTTRTLWVRGVLRAARTS